MVKIIESVPNISEGRNMKVVEACVDAVRNTKGCTLMDYSSDASHNRTVIWEVLKLLKRRALLLQR